MDSLLNRYRNITVLLLVLFAQLILLAYQVKTSQDVRLIRVWAVSGVTPLARLLETGRGKATRFVEDYVALVGIREDNRRLQDELGRLKMENQFLKTELATADRAQALAAFQARTPSRTIAARVIATGASPNAKVVFIDRGSTSGIQKGMAVITPDGIIGRVLASYPATSQVLLVTDPNFAAGVISSKYRVQGTLKGTGQSVCLVDYLQNEERIEPGEWFYTSGDDRLFPRGLPVGTVQSVAPGKTFKELYIAPSGFQRGLDEVLIVIEGVHQPIPEEQPASPGIYMLPAPSEAQTQPSAATEAEGGFIPGTEADRVRDKYKKLGDAQGHVYGQGPVPDFNIKPKEQGPAPAPGATASAAPSTEPQSTPPGAPPSAPAPPRVRPPANPGDRTPLAAPKAPANEPVR